MKRILLILATCFLAVGAQAEEWKTLPDDNEWKISYPSFLKLEPRGGDARFTFHDYRHLSSADNTVQLDLYYAVLHQGNYAMTHNGVEGNWTIQVLYNEEIAAHAKDVINYTVLKDDWFVISGTTPGGFEFYRKSFVFPSNDDGDVKGEYDGSVVTFTMEFSYPGQTLDQRKFYDPICEKIVRSFKVR
jgi:hypothetical protein